MEKCEKGRASYFKWITNVFEKTASRKLSLNEREWLLQNVHNLILSDDLCIITDPKKLLIDVNEQDILYVQNGKEYNSLDLVNKTKKAFVLLPINDKKNFYFVFWYIPKKNRSK